ncbi:MAG: DUF1887 family CARF protein [Cyanobacteriota bacterium]|nr:DUF1887 family CARF protein [Cyanobacteriota bacterium]
MQEKVMLILIGGRSATPAVAGALQFLEEVDRIKFLLCDGDDYLKRKDEVETVLQKENSHIICEKNDVKSVDPNNFDEVYKSVQELCSNVEDLRYVNLTSVPQTMAISVYSYVKDNYPQALIFSVQTNSSQIIPLVFGKKTIPFSKRLSVENYIAMCGLGIYQKKSGQVNPQWDIISRYFVEHCEISTEILSTIRSEAGGHKIKVPKRLKISEQALTKLKSKVSQLDLYIFFNKLEEHSLIASLKNCDQEISFRIETSESYDFLKGDWLEVFVYNKAKQCGFDSVERGIELDDYRGEIDVFCLNSANPIICECKTGKFKPEDFNKLNSKAEKLGANYCVKLFITSESEVSSESINTAKNNRTVIVNASELSNLEEILKKEMQDPTYGRK